MKVLYTVETMLQKCSFDLDLIFMPYYTLCNDYVKFQMLRSIMLTRLFSSKLLNLLKSSRIVFAFTLISCALSYADVKVVFPKKSLESFVIANFITKVSDKNKTQKSIPSVKPVIP